MASASLAAASIFDASEVRLSLRSPSKSPLTCPIPLLAESTRSSSSFFDAAASAAAPSMSPAVLRRPSERSCKEARRFVTLLFSPSMVT